MQKLRQRLLAWLKPLKPEDPACRFLTRKKDYLVETTDDKTEYRIQPDKLLPAPNSANNGILELSLFEVRKLDEEGIKQFLIRDGCPTQKLFGWATLPLITFFEHGLDLDFNNIPPRHLNIIGWKEDDLVEAKAKNLLFASLAAKSAVVVLSPPERTAHNPKYIPRP